MDTKTFLTRVSAALDDIVVCLWKPDPTGNSPTGIFWNRGSFSDVDDAVAAIAMWDKDPEWTVYYSIGRMAGHTYTKPNGKVGHRRTQDKATWFKTLCFDMDIGDKYKTQKEGLAALVDAAKKIGMPDPMVVNSGRGIHFYWPLTQPIDRDAWEKLSIALRLALEAHQVQIDASKIHDASMVLRPVGASHKKQTPWRTVSLVSDCRDYEIAELMAPLSPWVGKAAGAVTKKKKASTLSNAILRNCNLDVVKIGQKCKQIGALLASGGEFDAAGGMTKEPIWRASLGIAAFAVDQEAAMMLLCGNHPEFDYDKNIAKMAAWNAQPTSCGEFEKHCASGCAGCPYKGTIKGPGNLNESAPSIPTTPTAAAVAAAIAPPPPPPPPPPPSSGDDSGSDEGDEPESGGVHVVTPAPFEMPDGYYVSDGKIWLDVEKDVKEKNAAGDTITVTKKIKTLICPYEIHVVAMYREYWGDRASTESKSTGIIAVKYPDGKWQEHEMPLAAFASGGRELNIYFASKLMFMPDTQAVLTRSYLMTYLQRVQAKIQAGIDYTKFGWQQDGKIFLCGDKVIGPASTSTLNRLKGTARVYADRIGTKGDRNVWASATSFIDLPQAECLGVSLLTACIGVFNNCSGIGLGLIGFYSPVSGTGKTLALAMGSSTYMSPELRYMFTAKDTTNSLYSSLGCLNNLSGALDEYTMIDDHKVAMELAYDVVNGREKYRLDSNAALKDGATWAAPLRVSSNRSLYDMFDSSSETEEATRLRTIQFDVDSRVFVNEHGATLAALLTDNYGWAMPELINEVISMGGPKEVWFKGEAAFNKKFKALEVFQGEERYYRGIITKCWIIGEIGKKLGLFRFDTERIVNFMIQRIISLRNVATVRAKDAFDILGQFMQEHNHQMISVRKDAGQANSKHVVQFPVPAVACMRMETVFNATTAVLPGSVLAVNSSTLKLWLRKNKDSLERLARELQSMGALIDAHQRVTIYKGCQTANPGQAHCLVIDMTHPRFAAVMAGRPIPLTSPAAAVLAATP